MSSQIAENLAASGPSRGTAREGER